MAEMGTGVDVVVVGGGVIGASTAFHLARRGVRRVALLEKREIAAGASGRSGALVRMHYANPHEARIALAALPWFEEWGERIGGDCGFTRTGFLQLVAPHDRERLRQNVAMLREVGVPTDLIDAAAIRSLQPQLALDGAEIAAFEPRSGYADPVATARALAAAAAALGVRVMEGVEATRLAVDGGRVAGVETDRGWISASAVVLANGAWSAPLLAPLEIRPPIHPTCTQVAFFERPDALPGGAAGHLTIIDRAHGYYARPAGERSTLVGLSGSHRPLAALDDYPRENDPGFADLARRQVSRRIPALAGAAHLGGHKGPLDVTEDGKAILDRAPGVEGLLLAVGMSGTGFKKSPAIGACMAELLTAGRAETAPIEAFALGRFAAGAPIRGNDYSLPAETVDAAERDVLRGRGLVH
jgi:sarcosine oxidase subunit beta